MNNEVEIFKDKYQTLNKPQTQRIAQRSYIKGEVPIKDNRRGNLDRTHELIKTDLAQTYTSPARYNNSSRLKQNNRFNLNLSAVRKVSLQNTKATPSTKKSDRQRLNNTSYVNPSSSGYKEDSFLESRKKGRKKINGVLQEALSPHTADRKNKQPTFGIKGKFLDLP